MQPGDDDGEHRDVRVLVIEDEEKIARAIVRVLTAERYATDVGKNARLNHDMPSRARDSCATRVR